MTDWYLADLEDSFIRYVKIDTQSDESSPTHPSTSIQLNLQQMLVEELIELGARNVHLTDYRAVIATIPTTIQDDIPTIAFLAHVDTSPGFAASNIEPIVHRCL